MITENHNKITFPQWYYSLHIDKLKLHKSQIIQDCKLQVDAKNYCNVLYDWLTGRSKVSLLAQEKINAIAGQTLNYNIDDFENKPLKIQKPSTAC